MKRSNCVILFLVCCQFVFGQLTLDSCLNLARKNNYQLRRADLKIEQAKQVKNQVLTKFFPEVQLSAFAYHSLNPIIDVGIDDIKDDGVRTVLSTIYDNFGSTFGLENNLALFQYGTIAGLSVLQPIFMGGKIVEGNKMAGIGIEVAKLKKDISERDLLEEVERNFWLIVGLEEKRSTVDAMANLLDTIGKTVNAAVASGLALPTDSIQVQIRIDEVQRNKMQLNNGIKLAKRALGHSLGLPYNVIDTLVLDASDFANDIMFKNLLDNVNLSFENKCESPEHKLLAAQVKANKLQRDMVIADALPHIVLGASYGYSYIPEQHLTNGLGGWNGSLFVTLNIPISGWWEVGHKIKQSNLAMEEAKLEQVEMTEKLSLRRQQAFDQMQESALWVTQCLRSYNLANENVRLVQTNYRAGLQTISDLLTAQTTLLNAQNELTDARIAYRINLKRYSDL